MYIQITTKCNMACAHCLHSCRPGRGKHMPFDVAKKAIDIALEWDDPITIGGGEPTLHPNILAILGYSSMLSYVGNPAFMITNGACSESLWKVLIRARKGERLGLAVSKDPWHDMSMVPDFVCEDCDTHKLWWGGLGLGGVRRVIHPLGRARSAKVQDKLRRDALDYGYRNFEVDDTSCSDIRVDPDGVVWVDTNVKKRVGPLSDDTISTAKEILSRFEDGDAWE